MKHMVLRSKCIQLTSWHLVITSFEFPCIVCYIDITLELEVLNFLRDIVEEDALRLIWLYPKRLREIRCNVGPKFTYSLSATPKVVASDTVLNIFLCLNFEKL